MPNIRPWIITDAQWEAGGIVAAALFGLIAAVYGGVHAVRLKKSAGYSDLLLEVAGLREEIRAMRVEAEHMRSRLDKVEAELNAAEDENHLLRKYVHSLEMYIQSLIAIIKTFKNTATIPPMPTR